MLTPRRFPPILLSMLLPLACAIGDDEGRDSASAGLSAGSITSATTLTTAGEYGSSGSVDSGGGASTTGTPPADPTTPGDVSTGGDQPGASGEPGDGGEPGAGTTTGAGTSAGTSVGTSASTGDEIGPEPKFDLGAMPEPEDAPEKNSCVKVDLLFVIDNSGSMHQEQVNLIASVPGFVQEIQQELADADSLHIGVVTTDAYEYNEGSCAGVLGGLVTKTAGEGSSNAACGPYASGKRFMTEQDDLSKKFACAAQVGIDGSGDERPIDAALQALGGGLAAPGACNEGFLRDDALLVLVLITDEEEEHSIGDPPQWFNSLVALKGGTETNVVILSLIGPQDPACPDANEVNLRVDEFTKLFTYGSIGQICAASYQSFFHQSITGIAEACDNFIPG